MMHVAQRQTHARHPQPAPRRALNGHAAPPANDTTPPERLGSVLQFMSMLWAVDQGLRSKSKRMQSHMGLTGPQRLVIRVAGRAPWSSAGELAKILHVHPSTLTGIFKRLEAQGIIERKSDPQDSRRVLVGLTSKGREIDSLRAGTAEAAVRRTLSKLPPRKVAVARQVLGALAEALLEEE